MKTIYDIFPSLISKTKQPRKRYIIVLLRKGKKYVNYDNIYRSYEDTDFDYIIICLRKSGIILKTIDKGAKNYDRYYKSIYGNKPRHLFEHKI